MRQNQKVGQKIRIGSIRSTRIGARRKIGSIRSTSTGIEIGAKIRIETRRRKKVDTPIRFREPSAPVPSNAPDIGA